MENMDNFLNNVYDLYAMEISQNEDDNFDNNADSNAFYYFYCLRNKVVCIMEPQSCFAFFGKLKIKILYGNVEIYGTQFNRLNNNNDFIEVYSPCGHNFVSIKCKVSDDDDNNNSVNHVWAILKNDNINENINNKMQAQINNLKIGWSVLILENLDNNLTNFLKKYSTIQLFPSVNVTNNYNWTDIRRVQSILQSIIYNNKTSKFSRINFNEIDATIEKIIIQQNDVDHDNNVINKKIILTGGKGVGKSTTMRYLVNKLLKANEQVFVIDLDPGQCEFTPAGCISMNIIKKPLLGPNFTHLNQPCHQYFIGGADVSRYLSFYINSIKNLIEHLNNYIKDCDDKIPIVVNTMGFCRAIGFDIICYTIKAIQPTDVIQILSKDDRNNFCCNLNFSTVKNSLNSWATWTLPDNIHPFEEYNLHLVNSKAEDKKQLKEAWKIEPYQLREIALLSYLSQIINEEKFNSYDSNTPTINEISPYQIPFSDIIVSLESTLTTQILSIINGNIVALCGVNVKDLKENDGNSSFPKIFINIPLATCYGFGIVRGVDMEKEMVYINTPLSLSVLKKVNCLIGSIPVPLSLLQSNHSNMPYTGKLTHLPTSRDAKRRSFKSPRNKIRKTQT